MMRDLAHDLAILDAAATMVLGLFLGALAWAALAAMLDFHSLLLAGFGFGFGSVTAFLIRRLIHRAMEGKEGSQ